MGGGDGVSGGGSHLKPDFLPRLGGAVTHISVSGDGAAATVRDGARLRKKRV